MTTAYFGSRSRLNVLSRILGLPVLLAGYTVRTAFAEVRNLSIWGEIADAARYTYMDVRDELYALRQDFRPAIRFILTGKTHDTAVIERAAEVRSVVAAKAVSVRDRARSVVETAVDLFDRHVINRLFSFMLLLVLPVLALLYVGKVLSDDGFFSDVAETFVGLIREGVIGGRDPLEI